MFFDDQLILFVVACFKVSIYGYFALADIDLGRVARYAKPSADIYRIAVHRVRLARIKYRSILLAAV